MTTCALPFRLTQCRRRRRRENLPRKRFYVPRRARSYFVQDRRGRVNNSGFCCKTYILYGLFGGFRKNDEVLECLFFYSKLKMFLCMSRSFLYSHLFFPPNSSLLCSRHSKTKRTYRTLGTYLEVIIIVLIIHRVLLQHIIMQTQLPKIHHACDSRLRIHTTFNPLAIMLLCS